MTSRKRVLSAVFVLLLSLLVMTACGEKTPNAGTENTTASSDGSAVQKDYAFKVGEAKISKEFFTFAAKSQAKTFIDMGLAKTLDDEIEGKTVKQLIKDYIVDNLKYALAMQSVMEAEGFKIDEAKLEEKYKMLKENLELSKEAYEQNVANGLTDAILKEQIRISMFEEAYVEKVVESYKNSDEFKKIMKEEIVEVKARHILLETEEEAKKVLELVKKGDKTFSELAAEHSTDLASGKDGGDLGYFGKGAMVGEFEQAAFALEKGAVSDLVQTRFGYHIIQCEDKRTLDDMEKAGETPERIDSVKESLLNYYVGTKIGEKINEDLLKFQIDLNQEFLDGFQYE